MTSYTVKVTPALRTEGTEGGMDTSITNGVSAQRGAYIEVWVSGNRKMVSHLDGYAFDDTIPTWASFSPVV